jgi:hypothetical protein
LNLLLRQFALKISRKRNIRSPRGTFEQNSRRRRELGHVHGISMRLQPGFMNGLEVA